MKIVFTSLFDLINQYYFTMNALKKNQFIFLQNLVMAIYCKGLIKVWLQLMLKFEKLGKIILKAKRWLFRKIKAKVEI